MADEKNWTIMVYFAGDNNLNTEMVYALEEMKKIKNPNINLYVYFDGYSSNVPTLYCDFSNTDSQFKFYRSSAIKDKLIKRKVSEEFRFNENSASINNIINFVDWCVKRDRKAAAKGNGTGAVEKKYAMIFSGHSFSFLDWGLFKDDKANFYMTLSKLKWMFERITLKEDALTEIAKKEEAEQAEEALKRGFQLVPWNDEKLKERTAEIIGRPLDLLGFDSCLMSTLEIASQFKELANTMVASQGSVPNAGWNYAQILLGKLNDQANAGAKEIAVNFVDEFIKQQNKFALADISVDMAAWDLTALPKLEKDFIIFVSKLIDCFKENESTVYNQMRRILTHVHWQCQTFLYEQNVDLGDFCHLLVKEIELLKTETEVKTIAPIVEVGTACEEVLKRIRECILLTGFSGSDFQFSNGISIFFPWSWASYLSAKKDYLKLSFIKKSPAGEKWNEFLKKYLTEITLRKSHALTQTDREGNAIITADSESVVYESYTLLSEQNGETGVEDTNEPDEMGKQPPDGTRQPPDGTRLFGNMSIFLSRFMKLKNYQTNWNQSGFTSKRVKFKAKTEPAAATAVVRPETDVVGEIIIEKGTGIHEVVEEIRSRLKVLSDNKQRTQQNIESYVNLLDEINRNPDKPGITKILGSLSRSNLK
ncbi:MAG TPA: clostripain-related cysteine peptidase [Pyrinomonadaceae bacterium]|jgi:hypothetical protein